MKKRLLVIVPVLVTSVCLVYVLSLLDGFVYGTLYNYGLVFNPEWANPYWMMLRIVQILLTLNMIFSVLGCLYLYRKSVQVEPTMPRIVETPVRIPKAVETPVQIHTTVQKRPSGIFQKEKPKPQPKPEVTRESSESDVSNGLVKCNHCGKEFTQPLRMLDFHEDPPKMISVCPFCSEVMVQPGAEDAEKKRRLPFMEFHLNEKNHNQDA